MKLKYFLIFTLISYQIIGILSSPVENDKDKVKFVDENGKGVNPNATTYEKIKSNLKSTGKKVSNFFVNGYEETKNLFSKNRKVGDYTLDTIQVRVTDDEQSDENNQNNSQKRVQRSSDKEQNKHGNDDSQITTTTNTKLNPEINLNNAETSPGLPLVQKKIIARLCKLNYMPDKCKDVNLENLEISTETNENNEEDTTIDSTGFRIILAPTKCKSDERVIGARCRRIH